METLFIKGIACGLFYFAYVLSKFFLDSKQSQEF
ncbi:unknown [Firmicutes bacterium CAG:536]|nr:unknown [Firmicutes bacterium CAG:536]